MTKEELRIGNYVLGQTKQITKVDGFFNENKAIYTDVEDERVRFIIHHLNECEGVPLTEEILLKCGFNYESKLSDKDCMVYYLHDELGILWAGYLCLDINGSFIPLADTELNYLHQLQNLYFALTNKELNYDFNG